MDDQHNDEQHTVSRRGFLGAGTLAGGLNNGVTSASVVG